MANPPYCVRVEGAGGSLVLARTRSRKIVNWPSNTLNMMTVRWMAMLTSLEWLRIDKAGDHVVVEFSEHGPELRHLLGEASGDRVATR
jgi:hypothetical protein